MRVASLLTNIDIIAELKLFHFLSCKLTYYLGIKGRSNTELHGSN